MTRYGPCTPSIATRSWLRNCPRVALALPTTRPPVTTPSAGRSASTSAPCTCRATGANVVPWSDRSTSPRRTRTSRASTSTNTRSRSLSCCVVPSGRIGVFSSVSAARSVTPGATSPATSRRSPDVTEASRAVPATTPRVTEPVVRSPPGVTAGPARASRRAPRRVESRRTAARSRASCATSESSRGSGRSAGSTGATRRYVSRSTTTESAAALRRKRPASSTE